MKTKFFYKVLIILLPLWLIACNENGDSSIVAGGGIGGTGISIGPISSFGSIFVNGIKFNTDNSIIIINGQEATATDLKVGMMVQVEGSINPDNKTGNASHIEFNDNVRGPIQSIDNNSLIVLGQKIIVNKLTVLESIIDITELNLGEIVNVSGLVDADGTIHATRIARDNSFTEFEVSGKITKLDLVTQTFSIADLIIDYSQAMILNLPAGIPNNELLVEVKGEIIDNILIASSITTEDELSAEAGTRIEIEGFITQFNNKFDFEVAQLPVTTTEQTIFKFGNSEDLAKDVLVEVEGKLDVNGVLIIEELSFNNATSKKAIEIEADVEAIDFAKQTVTLLGLSIQTTAKTHRRDQSDALIIPFGLSDLRISDRVAITGFVDSATDSLIAEVLLRKPFRADGQVILEATADNIASNIGSLEILNITIMTDQNTVFYEESTYTDKILTAEQFWNRIQQPNLLIEAQGILIGEAVLASRLEIGD